MKPKLTDANKLERVAWCLDKRKANGLYSEMLDEIHVDEKWFFLDELTMTYYLADGEQPKHRSVQHKSHIQKVMFLCAVARPKHDTHSNVQFSGKIGIWPFVKVVAAQRSSRHRARGTMEIKPVNVTKEVYLDMMLQKVLPAIKANCPLGMKSRRIILQQDNAPPHRSFTNANPAVVTKLEELGLNLEIRNQPANSPDLNVLDLG